jgi:hypothetical protein
LPPEQHHAAGPWCHGRIEQTVTSFDQTKALALKSEDEEYCVENPQPDMSAIEMTDEEIWRTIRDLDPDQRRNTSDVACVIAIVVACIVWYWLIFAASK